MRMNIPTASNAIQTKSAPLSLRPASSARPAVAAIAAVARSAFPVLATLAALATVTTLTTLPVGAQTRTQTVYVSPNPVESGRAFQVTVSGRTSLCDPQFSHHDAKVEKGLVNFTVMAVNNPLAKCSGEVRDFKTDFTVPALKKGTYPVEARLYPACAYDKTPCPMLLDPVEYGGDLLVQDSADLFLAMRPDKVSADKAFDLFVTSKYYTCGNEYSNLSTQVEGHILYVNYTNRPNQEAICQAILKDYGPTFKVPAMKAGVYQVFATVNPYCAPNTPCPLIMMAPQLAGALTVGEGATALNGEGGPGKGGSEIGNAARGQGFKNGSLRVDARGGVTVRWNNGTSTVTGKRQ